MVYSSIVRHNSTTTTLFAVGEGKKYSFTCNGRLEITECE
jgi:hypothetical protein